jgi:two-component system nitrogen regulation response regulator NtrX
VLRKLHALDETLPVVMISGHGTTATAVEAIRSGAVDFLDKPLSSERVIVTLQNALRQSELRSENRELKLAMESKYEIVGQSPALQKVLDSVRRAAPTNATVLLLGESGVGKELVARTIHRNSTRAGQRFIQVNCAAIPEELIESELFGHEKGSFTGATEKQIGKFEQADRGTIFLDEVGDMSPKTQAKVLRVLQEQEVERLGSARTIKVDVRVIAATNKKLEEAVERGEFREDLYFRLNVIPIVVPPLRERREDIPSLVQHFTRRMAEEHNVKPKRFDGQAMDALRQYRWRGNIRELRNTIERVMIMTPDDVVRMDDLPVEVRRGDSARPAESAAAGGADVSSPELLPPAGAGTLREFKDASERAYLVQKLRENNWNISKTAEIIDTPRSNLYKKLEQYGIKQEVDG